MADESFSSADKAVFAFFEAVALGFALSGVEKILDERFLIAILSWGISFVLSVIGFKWPQIKLRMGIPLVSRVERIANSYRFRVGFSIVIIGIACVYGMLYLHSLRSDLDIYAMPRVVTDVQASEIRKVLSPYNPQIVVNVAADDSDQEAIQYADELASAIDGPGWDVHIVLITVLGERRFRAFENYYVTVPGVNIVVGFAGPPENEDPKHPSPGNLLSNAFNAAHMAYGAATSAEVGESSVNIVVGHRPLAVVNYSFRTALRLWAMRNL